MAEIIGYEYFDECPANKSYSQIIRISHSVKVRINS